MAPAEHQRRPPLSELVVLLATLAAFAAAVPVSLPGTDGPGSSEQCLTLADRAPAADASRALYEECSQRLPDDVELLADLGALYERDGAHEQAEATYRRVVNLSPDFADARLRLAHLLLRRGAAAEARVQAERGLAIQPNRDAFRAVLEQVR